MEHGWTFVHIALMPGCQKFIFQIGRCWTFTCLASMLDIYRQKLAIKYVCFLQAKQGFIMIIPRWLGTVIQTVPTFNSHICYLKEEYFLSGLYNTTGLTKVNIKMFEYYVHFMFKVGLSFHQNLSFDHFEDFIYISY